MPDKDWIPLAVQQGFVLVSGDRNATTRRFTVSDLKQMEARVLLFGSFWDHLGGWERAKWLVSRIEGIVDDAASLSAGGVSLVPRFGKATPQ